MYFDYALPRFFGAIKEQIISWGNTLNYGITWDSTERVFSTLSAEVVFAPQVAELIQMHNQMSETINTFTIA